MSMDAVASELGVKGDGGEKQRTLGQSVAMVDDGPRGVRAGKRRGALGQLPDAWLRSGVLSWAAGLWAIYTWCETRWAMKIFG